MKTVTGRGSEKRKYRGGGGRRHWLTQLGNSQQGYLFWVTWQFGLAGKLVLAEGERADCFLFVCLFPIAGSERKKRKACVKSGEEKVPGEKYLA